MGHPADRLLKQAVPAEPHFLGAVVLQDWQTSYQEMLADTIIDGRSATLQLLLRALADGDETAVLADLFAAAL
ncbi:hypothetical protein [Actinomyces ruminicola]|uniref:Uncharacterized protein n=1 Tax=Actinomyces ruminicola TaxID=332524 RepID=A0A1G9RTN2_9ACTO|nr:hypothetical protein [Actinomyces ruminicola]SDM25845.1 hypothetical protein SAMN04487766_101114 [Actinomyces ruminicola]